MTFQNISFPLTRLASVNSADKSTTFLYHQINGTTFAEEQWDESLKFWVATEYLTLTGNLGSRIHARKYSVKINLLDNSSKQPDITEARIKYETYTDIQFEEAIAFFLRTLSPPLLYEQRSLQTARMARGNNLFAR